MSPIGPLAGTGVGSYDGSRVDFMEGEGVGFNDGSGVGCIEGEIVGLNDGRQVNVIVGFLKTSIRGIIFFEVGSYDGSEVD